MALSPHSKDSPEFGNFTLLAKLARGTIGDLFLARSEGAGGFEKLVIIKRIHSSLMRDETVSQQFFREVKATAQIEHPNVRMVYEIGRTQDHHYIALEYLEGISLVDILLGRKEHPELADPRLVVSFLVQACQGLSAAHTHGNTSGTDRELSGPIHGDINPRSLFITAAGTTKILDFDMAGIRTVLSGKHGFTRRTSAYMSPEEIRSGHSDRRSDIFSLGVVVWEAVTGRRLFKQDTHAETRSAILSGTIPSASQIRPDISDVLNATIMRAIHIDPSLRFQSAGDFGTALERALLSEGPPLAPLNITAQIQSIFYTKLKEQRAFVRAARAGKAESDHVVRTFRTRTESIEEIVSLDRDELDWETEYTVATQVANPDAQPIAPARADSVSDPFIEVSQAVDFSDTHIAPSWGDTHNFVLPDFSDSSSESTIVQSPTLEVEPATVVGKRNAKRPMVPTPTVLAAKPAPPPINLPTSPTASPPILTPTQRSQIKSPTPLPLTPPPAKPPTPTPPKPTENREHKDAFPAGPVGKPTLDEDEKHSRKLVWLLALASAFVGAAILMIFLTRSSPSSNSPKAQLQSPPQREVIPDAGKAPTPVPTTLILIQPDAGTRSHSSRKRSAVIPSSLLETEDNSPKNTSQKSATAKGTLKITSKPKATVYVDGKRVGTTPYKTRLSPTLHRLKVINLENGKTKRLTVRVKSGDTIRRNFHF